MTLKIVGDRTSPSMLAVMIRLEFVSKVTACTDAECPSKLRRNNLVAKKAARVLLSALAAFPICINDFLLKLPAQAVHRRYPLAIG